MKVTKVQLVVNHYKLLPWTILLLIFSLTSQQQLIAMVFTNNRLVELH